MREVLPILAIIFLFDAIRGATKRIKSNSTDTEATFTNMLTSFNSNGFSLGDSNQVNFNNDDFVSWNWKAGGTPTATNSAGAGNAPTSGSVMIDGSASTASLAGTIPVTKLSANTEAGFSIQSWTGDSSGNATIAHGLTKAPEMIIIKPLDESRNRLIWHHELGDNDKAFIWDTDGSVAADNRFGPNAPTATVYGLYNNQGNRNGTDFIGYAFHGVEGYSKFGRYEGNGQADGQYVYLGFRPSYIMIKQFDAENRWIIFDSKRGDMNPLEEKLELNPNDSSAEGTSGTDCFDFYSNGFKLRRSGDVYNGSTHDYLYMAFAEMPFKYANAR